MMINKYILIDNGASKEEASKYISMLNRSVAGKDVEYMITLSRKYVKTSGRHFDLKGSIVCCEERIRSSYPKIKKQNWIELLYVLKSIK